ncbi:MAG TPA: hypothetical protein VE262_06715 [Blastocatellia bacterium]|nr:hypothetical protein [Blastocatellia bacterium]
MPDEPIPQNPARPRGDLPEDAAESMAGSDAFSTGEQPAMIANLALANKIFSASLAQQNMIINQQAVFQIELAALAKCIQVLLAFNASEPEAIEQLTARMLEMFNQLHAKVEERLVASQKQMNELMDEMRAHAMAGVPEKL